MRLVSASRVFPPQAGHLVSPPPQLTPWSQRELSRLTGIPRSTLRGHIPELVRAGHLLEMLGGHLVVKPLLDSAPTTTTNGSGDVENVGMIHAPPGEMGAVPPAFLPGARPPAPKQDQILLRTASVETEDVENPAGQPVSTADWMSDLPSELDNSTTRYLLAKLAISSNLWAAALRSPRDLSLLTRLHVSHPAELIAALQQVHDDPAEIRNPGAWLTRTVPAIAEAS